MSPIDPAFVWLNLTRLGILVLTALLAWATYRTHLLLKEYKPDVNLLLSPPELVMRVILAGICLLLAWTSGLPASQLGFTSPSPLRTIGTGIGIGLVIVIGINLVTQWLINRFGRQIYSPQVIRNVLPRRAMEWGLTPLAFLPAVVMEELLFRSLWLGGFSDIVPLPILILGTSVIFGLMHQPQGRLGVLIAGTINALFSFLFIQSGQLLLPLTAHYIVNVSQLVVAYFQRDELENY